MVRFVSLTSVLALAAYQMAAQSNLECVQQGAKYGMTHHEVWTVRRACSDRFRSSDSSTSTTVAHRPSTLDQFDLDVPSPQSAPPKVASPATESPP
jgi:hypothetical protein